jgi:hypothetical protein
VQSFVECKVSLAEGIFLENILTLNNINRVIYTKEVILILFYVLYKMNTITKYQLFKTGELRSRIIE